MKFYVCPVCGNVIYVMNGEIGHVKCCGVDLVELIPNTVDASAEKHVPFCEVYGDKVRVNVGEVLHPMDNDHYIMWVVAKTDENVSFVKFNIGDEPSCEFVYKKGMVIYSYCNKHGLWKKEI